MGSQTLEKMKGTDEVMRGLADSINAVLKAEFKEPVGFALLLFEFFDATSDKANVERGGNYISNANREDMIKLLRETADRLEAHEDIGMPIGEA